MPSSKPARISVTCPKCGHTQPEPPSAYSTICKKCRQYFRVQETLQPAPPPPESASGQRRVRAGSVFDWLFKKVPLKPALELKRVRCFRCGTELEVPVAATSTMCKRCGSYVDVSDYRIARPMAKNVRTRGMLVVEEKGYALNADVLVGDAIIKGRFTGKLVASGKLEIHSSARIKGTLTAARLVIPAGHHFRWPEPLRVEAADISGELVAALQTKGTVWLRSTARFFGAVQARNLVVESGAVFVGTARVGTAC